MRIIVTFLVVTFFTNISAQVYNPNFNEEYIQDYLPSIEITMFDTAYNWMIHPDNVWSDVYQHATAVYHGSNNQTINYSDLGIRLRGNTSRTKHKKSFKIHFETYTSNQYFFGLKKLNLKAETNDPSLIREHLVMNLYREVNIPVARVNHVKLYINANYMGLYSSIEQIDKRFLLSRFNNDTGNLYKCSWGADLADIGDVYDDGIYELKTNETTNDRSKLMAFVNFLSTSSDTNFEMNIESYFNVNTYLKQLAIEVLIGHWDAYSYNMNNYYLYHNPSKNWFEYIPYDADNTFGIDWVNRDWSDRNIYDWAKHGNDQRPLHIRILNINKYLELYSQIISDLIQTRFNASHQMLLASSYHSLISNEVHNDTFYPLDFGFTNQNFDKSLLESISNTHVDYGIEPFIDRRVSYALSQLNQNHLSVDENLLSNNLIMYPLPISKNQPLTIEWNQGTNSNLSIFILNNIGQEVYHKQNSSSNRLEIKLDNFKSGIYYIHFKDTQSNTNGTKLLIIN
jgi:hypothetical protein